MSRWRTRMIRASFSCGSRAPKTVRGGRDWLALASRGSRGPPAPYVGGQWKLHVQLPKEYPYKSPSIGFLNRMYHPNVDERCVDARARSGLEAVSGSDRASLHPERALHPLQVGYGVSGRDQPDVEPHVRWVHASARAVSPHRPPPLIPGSCHGLLALRSGADLVNVFSVFLPQLLRYPNPTDPLNGEAAALMLRDAEQYNKRVQGARGVGGGARFSLTGPACRVRQAVRVRGC